MKYIVRFSKIDEGESTAEFKTKASALDCVFILISGLQFDSRYSISNYLERQLKDRNCVSAGIDSSCKSWSVTIEKSKLK